MNASPSPRYYLLPFVLFGLLMCARAVAQQTSGAEFDSQTAFLFDPKSDLRGATAKAGALKPSDAARLEVLKSLRPSDIAQAVRQSTETGNRAALASAEASVKRGDLSGAETIIVATNRYEPNTGKWHLTNAQQWQELATSLSAGAQRNSASVASSRALQSFAQAALVARASADGRTEAFARSGSAWIRERFSGDLKGALEDYRAAVAANPADEVSRRAAGRIERSLAVLESRLKSRR